MIQKISGNLRQEQAAATRAKLLESAKRLFAEHGYKGTSVRMINRSVGLADGLLYHYFPDGKKEIFQAVVEQQLSQLMDVLDEQYTADSYAEIPLEQALEKIYRIFVREMEERLDLFRILFRENEVRGSVRPEDIQRLLGSRELWFPDFLETKYEMGEIRKMDFTMASFLVKAVLMNHVLMKMYGEGCCILEQEEIRKRLIDHQVNMWKKE